MGTPYIGEIRMVGFNFAPTGWAFCDGQTLAISQNATLFNLIGTTYGGDGINTFNLPDLQGRFPAHYGTSSFGSSYVFGQSAGSETVMLTINQMPVHNHMAVCAAGGGTTASPVKAFWSTDPQGNTAAYNNAPDGSSMASGALAIAGSGLPHENRQPYLGLNFIISMFGIFPSRT